MLFIIRILFRKVVVFVIRLTLFHESALLTLFINTVRTNHMFYDEFIYEKGFKVL